MDSQVLTRDYNETAFPKNNKSKKASQPATYNKSIYNKPTGPSSKGNYPKNYPQKSQTGYNQHQPSYYPSWNVFNGPRPSTKGGYGQSYAKFEEQPYNYAKNYQLSYIQESYSDKASRSTGVSDNDNGSSDIFSELSGFKIVQSGRTIYNEANEEEDLFSDSDSNEAQKPKFASSEYTIGPNARDISIPSFADE